MTKVCVLYPNKTWKQVWKGAAATALDIAAELRRHGFHVKTGLAD
ncbi:MAG TPA: hypothetical protein VG753_03345 [Candidatus Paceibacterota bacterium]|nr:hypothetical protein [Candidatus Paceibacterota bacterium]